MRFKAVRNYLLNIERMVTVPPPKQRATLELPHQMAKSSLDSAQSQHLTPEYVDITGFTASPLRLATFIFLSVVTCGILPLLAKWKPWIWTHLARQRCQAFRDAGFVLVVGPTGKTTEITILVTSTIVSSNNQQSLQNIHYFEYRKQRYVYVEAYSSFQRQNPRLMDTFANIHEMRYGKSNEEAAILYANNGPNSIDVGSTPIERLIADKITHPFYIFQFVSVSIWLFESYISYAILILLMSLASIGWEVYTSKRNENHLKTMTKVDAVYPVLRQGLLVHLDASDLVVGDAIVLSAANTPLKDSPVVCDMVLIQGECVMDESSLTGETIPVVKLPLPFASSDETETTQPQFDADRHKSHVLFGGSRFVEIKPKRNWAFGQSNASLNDPEMAVAIVMATGFTSSKGELFRSILFPTHIDFKFNRDAYKFLTVLGVVAFIAFLNRCMDGLRAGIPILTVIISSLDLVTIAVPPALPLVLTVGTGFSIDRLKNAFVYCINPDRINYAGRVDVMCWDKTGTLTVSSLDFCGLDRAENRVFKGLTRDGSASPLSQSRRSATCGSHENNRRLNMDSLFYQVSGATSSVLFDQLVSQGDQTAATTSVMEPIETRDSVGVPDVEYDNRPWTVPMHDQMQQPDHHQQYQESNIALEHAMVLCHGVTVAENGHMFGHSLDIEMVQRSGWTPLREDQLEVFSEGLDIPVVCAMVPPLRVSNMHTPGADTNRSVSPSMARETTADMIVSPTVPLLAAEMSTNTYAGSSTASIAVDPVSFAPITPPSIPSPSKTTIYGHDTTHMPLSLRHTPGMLVLRRFDFDAHLQRSSVIATLTATPHTTSWYSFIKGSPESVRNVCKHESIPTNYFAVCQSYAIQGFYVIACAYKRMSGVGVGQAAAAVDVSRVRREDVERDLEFLGLLLFRNPIKSEADETIRLLKDARIRSVIITGDNALTAIHVARELDLCEHAIMIDVHESEVRFSEIPHQTHLLDTANNYGSTPTLDKSEPHSTFVSTSVLTGQTNGSLESFMNTEARRHHHIDDLVHQLSLMPPQTEMVVTGAALSMMCDRMDFDFVDWVVGRTRIFARTRPDQKTWVIERLARLGKYVGMCGDGTNDCGALKAAHVGMALSDAEASIVAPFTSAKKSVADILILVREGRCALETSFVAFKYMTLYPIIQLIMSAYLNEIGSALSSNQFFFDDMGIVTMLALLMLYTKPADNLARERPTDDLFSPLVLASILGEAVLAIIFFSINVAAVSAQPWFCSVRDATVNLNASFIPINDTVSAYPCYPIDPTTDTTQSLLIKSYENTTVWLFSHFMFAVVALTFCLTTRYRAPFWTNVMFTGYLAFLCCVLVAMLLLLVNSSTAKVPGPAEYADIFSWLFNIQPGIPISFRFLQLGVLVVYTAFSVVWEVVVVDNHVRKYSIALETRRVRMLDWKRDRAVGIDNAAENGSLLGDKSNQHTGNDVDDVRTASNIAIRVFEPADNGATGQPIHMSDFDYNSADEHGDSSHHDDSESMLPSRRSVDKTTRRALVKVEAQRRRWRPNNNKQKQPLSPTSHASDATPGDAHHIMVSIDDVGSQQPYTQI